MKAVTSALASGAITPGKAERIAAVVDTFVGRSMPTISIGACRDSKTRQRRALRPALQRRGRPRSTTDRRVFAADLLLICCRCCNVKQSVQSLIASRGHGHWQDGMLFAIIREGIAETDQGGLEHGATA